MFISNAGGAGGDGQAGGIVLETLLNLILREKAAINLQENTGSSKPMEDFIRQFTAVVAQLGTAALADWKIRTQKSEVRGQE